MNRDKFVLNTTITDGERLRDMVFLGKLIGLAVRHGLMVPLNLPSLVWKPLVGEAVDIKDLSAIDSGLCERMGICCRSFSSSRLVLKAIVIGMVSKLTADQLDTMDPEELQSALGQCKLKVQGADGRWRAESISSGNREQFLGQVWSNLDGNVRLG